MAGENAPKPILSINERKPSDFSEFELLGMDEPKYEVRNQGGAKDFPAIVAYLDKYPAKAQDILARFELTNEVYDPESNPGGILLSEPVTKREYAKARIANHVALRFAGVTSTTLSEFFSYSSGALAKLSPAFKKAVTLADRKRANYALEHREEFPKIQALFGEIEHQTGLKGAELFTVVPALSEWLTPQGSNRNIRPIVLQEALEMILALLKGESMYALAARLRRPSSSVTQFFKYKVSDRLNQAIAGKKNGA